MIVFLLSTFQACTTGGPGSLPSSLTWICLAAHSVIGQLASFFVICVLQDAVLRGETLVLKSNTDNRNWELQNSSGKIKTLPGACFMIPPPDPEALQTVKRYAPLPLPLFRLI